MKTFADLAPNDTQWEQIQRLTKGGLDRADVAVLPMLVINSQPTVYFTVPDQSWFAQALADINGDEGVSLQLNHKIKTLPVGRLFSASLSQNEGMTTLIAFAFTRDRELVDKYLAGEVQAVSAGLTCSTMRCGICGNKWLSEKCVAFADEHNQKIHWPGEKFDNKVCLLYYVCENGARALREVSPVYCGASAGRLLDGEKAMKIASTGALYAEACAMLAHNKDKQLTPDQCKRAAEKFNDAAATLVLPVAPAADDRSDRSDRSDELLAQIAALLAEKEAALAALANADEAGAAANRECIALNEENQDLKANLSAATAALAVSNSASAELLAKLDVAAIPAGLKPDASADDKLAALAGMATMAAALRAFLHEQAETYCIKAHGNAAAPPAITVMADAPGIIAAFTGARDEFLDVHKMPPLTAPAPKAKRQPVPRTPAAFRMRKS